MCCHWQVFKLVLICKLNFILIIINFIKKVDDCFGRINNDKELTNRVVSVACSKFNKVYTNVEFPRGGYIVVEKSSDPELDNKIIVYGHKNNNLGYWYDCGSKDKLHFDFEDLTKIEI